jgi:hypothetical protein
MGLDHRRILLLAPLLAGFAGLFGAWLAATPTTMPSEPCPL